MKENTENDFNTKYCARTACFAAKLFKIFYRMQGNEATRILLRQVLRSGTSVAVNFRAASRARSDKEFYSKMCIIVEECDETCFWLDLISELPGFPKDHLSEMKTEAEELLKVFAKARKTMRLRISCEK